MTQRVRLVFETEAMDAEEAALALEVQLGNPDIPVERIFKEIKLLRPFTKKEGVVYGRPKQQPDTFGLD